MNKRRIMSEGVSVIICCHNSAGRVIPVLEHLSSQRFTKKVNWEIIVVDNNSADETATVSETFLKKRTIDYQVIKEPNPGLSHARKAGIKSARYAIVSFIDDDNLVVETWVETVLNIMENNPHVGICGGIGEAEFETTPPFWFADFQGCYATGPQFHSRGLLDNTRSYLYGAGLSLRKEAWGHLINNGFSFKLTGRKGKSLNSGEDSELCIAIRLAGYEIFYEPNLTFKHIMYSGRLTWPYLLKLGTAIGNSGPILQIYKGILFQHRGLKKLLFSSPLFSIINSLYNLLLLLPGLTTALLTKREGSWEIYKFKVTMGSINATLSMIFNYRQMVNSISRAKWVHQKYK